MVDERSQRKAGPLHRSLPRSRRVMVAALAAGVTAAVVMSAQPASAAPVIYSSVAPMSGPTAGGTPIRIYGTGFTGGTVIVQFENVNATDFQVIDDNLITAVVPAAAGGTGDNNTYADVEVQVGAFTDTWTDGFLYTNATFTVAGRNGASSPYGAGDDITTTLDGYLASTNTIVVQMNPLLVYIENFPEFDPPVPPPYTEILRFEAATDANGDVTDSSSELANPFDGSNNDGDPYGPYDTNIACPVNQTTANYLGNSASISLNKPAYSGKCMIATGYYGSGMLERAIDMDNDPTPAAPTLSLSTGTASANDVVTFSGANWNANPFFGSSKLADNPGETTTTAQICYYSPSEYCSTTVGSATVTPSRYIHNGTSFAFSGATLSGSITVGTDLPTTCAYLDCVVKVKQFRPVSGNLVSMWPIVLEP